MSRGLEVDAVVELPDGRWSAFEIKLGGHASIDAAATNLKKLVARVTESRAAALARLVVLTAGATSYVRDDGVAVVALGHLAIR